MKYLKLKIEDAVNATKAAIEEGIVIGGGAALIKVIGKIQGYKNLSKEEEIGFNILLKAIEMPLKQIAINAGKDDGSAIVEKIKELKNNTAGYDASKDEIVQDMFLAGIVDPVKVVRSEVQNAVSAAGILLTMEVAIADEPEEDKNSGVGGGMSAGMPGMGGF